MERTEDANSKQAHTDVNEKEAMHDGYIGEDIMNQ